MVLKVERPQHRQRLVRGRGRLSEQFAEHLGRGRPAAAPHDLAGCGRLPTVVHDGSPGRQPSVPVAGRAKPSGRVSANAERLEFPAVTGGVPRRHLGPGKISRFACDTTQRDRSLAAHGRRGVGGKLRGESQDVPAGQAAHPHRDHPQVLIRFGGEPRDPYICLIGQHAHRPGQPGLEPRILGGVKGGGERGCCRRGVAGKPLQCRGAGREVWACQRRDRTGDRREVDQRHRPGRTGGRDSVDAALFRVAHAVAAHARVVPVGHDQRAVRSHAHVARPKPAVGRAVHNRLARRLIPGAGRLYVIRPHHVRAGVAVNERAAKSLG